MSTTSLRDHSALYCGDISPTVIAPAREDAARLLEARATTPEHRATVARFRTSALQRRDKPVLDELEATPPPLAPAEFNLIRAVRRLTLDSANWPDPAPRTKAYEQALSAAQAAEGVEVLRHQQLQKHRVGLESALDKAKAEHDKIRLTAQLREAREAEALAYQERCRAGRVVQRLEREQLERDRQAAAGDSAPWPR